MFKWTKYFTSYMANLTIFFIKHVSNLPWNNYFIRYIELLVSMIQTDFKTLAIKYPRSLFNDKKKGRLILVYWKLFRLNLSKMYF